MEDPEKSHPKVFRLKGYVVGCIVAIGPFPTEILSITSPKTDEPSHEEASTTAPGSNLFLVKSYYRKETPRKTGIATSLARSGDLVCWIGGVSRALLLRRIKFINNGDYKFWQVLSTALITRDFGRNDTTHHAADLASFDKETMDLKVDAATIYLLVS
ncbi:hypothetical protein BofuT4_P095720.1 [Botrytis cinerea T4]|uniref:Uncharacterized protein n=1 Tax=Botryotinia fuckeliana (strain T4) TaxID=999810 RepID=G2YDL6_BOTF4|nr:hypothetical protein BofuT4_P095720.1 [Botrytis cinerea T4]